MVRRLRAPLLTAGATAGLVVALRVRDPHDTGAWGYCPWHLLTGGWCPGCGALRAVNDLSRGDLAGAASSNLLFLLAIPALVWGWSRWVAASREGRRTTPPAWVAAHPRPVVAVAALVTVAFTVLRNLPGSWLAP